MQNGWIKLHRKLEEWGWSDDPHMVSLLVHMLIAARTSRGEYHGHIIERGSFVFGRRKWSEKTGISERSLRTCIKRLLDTNEITIKSTSKFSVVTIVKYDDYQSYPQDSDQQPTSNRPATDHIQKNERMKEYNINPHTPFVDNSVDNFCGFDVCVFLDDGVFEQARRKAPEWDIYFLAGVFNESVRSGRHPKPDNPAGAFIAWCGKYTKGRRP